MQIVKHFLYSTYSRRDMSTTPDTLIGPLLDLKLCLHILVFLYLRTELGMLEQMSSCVYIALNTKKCLWTFKEYEHALILQHHEAHCQYFVTLKCMSPSEIFLSFLPRCMKCRRGLAMRILSVCPSVTRVIPDKMEERLVHIFIPYERTFSVVFWEEEWLLAGDPFYLKFWVNRPPLGEIADFQPIIARSASAVTPSE